MTNSVDFYKLFSKLQSANLPQSEFVKFNEGIRNPYIVLIGCILSLRTNDKTTYPATLRMLELAKTPEDMSKVSVSDLEKAIYPVGFYKNKAKQIIEFSKLICDKYNGHVPNSIDELVKFKGVGRKTANLVLAKGFCIPAICVDVHVHRIFNRMGIVKTKDPTETEMKLREIVPVDLWLDLNTLFVTLGQNICKPTKPDCNSCPVAEFCKKS